MRRSIAARRQHRTVRVHNGDDTRCNWDGVAWEAIGIPAAVESLMVVPDNRGYSIEERHLAEQVVPNLCVRADQLTLCVHQWSGLVEHSVAHADGSDVV